MFAKITSAFTSKLVKSYKRIDKELYRGCERYRVVFIKEYDNGKIVESPSDILHWDEDEAILYAKNFVKCDENHNYRYSTISEIIIYPQNYEALEEFGYFVYDQKNHYIVFRVYDRDTYDDTYFFCKDKYSFRPVNAFINSNYIDDATKRSKLNIPKYESLYIVESNVVKTDISSKIKEANSELKELKECLQQYNNITEASKKLLDTLYANNRE